MESVFVEDSLNFLPIRGLRQSKLKEYSCLVRNQVVPFDKLVLRVDRDPVVHASPRREDYRYSFGRQCLECRRLRIDWGGLSLA